MIQIWRLNGHSIKFIIVGMVIASARKKSHCNFSEGITSCSCNGISRRDYKHIMRTTQYVTLIWLLRTQVGGDMWLRHMHPLHACEGNFDRLAVNL